MLPTSAKWWHGDVMGCDNKAQTEKPPKGLVSVQLSSSCKDLLTTILNPNAPACQPWAWRGI